MAYYKNNIESADPGLGQGRGGAWDHRRCGTSPSSLSKVKPISQPASCPKATSRKHFPGMLRPPVKTSRHLDMKITCFGKPLKRWLGMLHPAANSHPEATHQWLHYGPLKQSLGMLHPAANRHPKATHQWLLMGVQACRLPALKPSKPSKPLKTLKPLKRWLGMLHPAAKQPPRGHTSMASYGPLKQSLGMLHPAANRHPKATHQWLLMGVQACRLPALKPLKPSKPLKTLKPLKRWLGMLHPAANSHPEATHQWLLMGRLNNPLACFILQPTSTPRPHINGFLWASKPAVCQPLNPPNPPNP